MRVQIRTSNSCYGSNLGKSEDTNNYALLGRRMVTVIGEGIPLKITPVNNGKNGDGTFYNLAGCYFPEM